MEVKAIWNKKMSFTGTAESGFSLLMDTVEAQGGDNNGFRPMELLLVGLAGCTGMDVISILEKKHQKVTHLEVKISAERAQDHPKVYTKIIIEYIFGGENLDHQSLIRAVELSETKYCPASAMLSKTAQMERVITIL